MDPHTTEMILRHSTTALCAWLAGTSAQVLARNYALRVNAGQEICLRTLVLAARDVLSGALKVDHVFALHKDNAVAGVLMLAACFWAGWGQSGPGAWLFIAMACWILLLLAAIDARTGYLPDALTGPFLLLGMGFVAVMQPWSTGVFWVVHGLLAALVLPGICMLIHWLRRATPGMGWGDLKLLAGMGVWLGPSSVVFALLLACVLGLVFTTAHARGLRLQASYPFGPFLAGATALFLLHPHMSLWI